MKKTRALLVKCQDEKGIIHRISGVLLKSGCNVIGNREFVDIEKRVFYMRTEFEANGFDSDEILKELKAILPTDAQIMIPQNRKKKVVILATKEHHCLSELLSRNYFEEFNFEVSAVIANHNDLQVFTNKFGIDFHHISCEEKTKNQQEQEVIAVLEKEKPDLVVLAKYMRILSPEFVQKYKNKIVNIHHSFLPAFIGANPYRKAYERGVKLIGATAHFVTSELDQGPIIIQDVARVGHMDDVVSMKKKSHDLEKLALTKAIRLICDDRIFINGNKTIIFE